MTGNLYWLASYPKSGNTWMRILLTNYWLDGDRPVSINDLEGGPIASARAIFDDNVGVEASDLTQDEIERLRPLVYDAISDGIARSRAGDPTSHGWPAFMKVHDAYTTTADGRPLLSPAATAGAVYLVRNPLDVAVSFAHHGATSIDRTIANMANPDFVFAGGQQKLHNQLRQRVLTWSGHVESWLDAPGLDLLVVRYEDLSADPEHELGRVLRFAGLDPEPARVAKAVEFSSFERLQQQESESGFRERMPRSQSFFRRGTVGSWSSDLSDEQVERLRTAHGRVMTRLDYA